MQVLLQLELGKIGTSSITGFFRIILTEFLLVKGNWDGGYAIARDYKSKRN